MRMYSTLQVSFETWSRMIGCIWFLKPHMKVSTSLHVAINTTREKYAVLCSPKEQGGAVNNINMSILVCLIRCDTISTFFRTKKVVLYCIFAQVSYSIFSHIFLRIRSLIQSHVKFVFCTCVLCVYEISEARRESNSLLPYIFGDNIEKSIENQRRIHIKIMFSTT